MYKPIIIDNMHTNYIIDENGIIINIKTNKVRKISKIDSNHRYCRVSLVINGKSKSFALHRLLMMTFCPIENMENLEVNHIDGNRENNNLSNLEWCTRSENMIHACCTGLHPAMYGTDNPRSKLTETQVVEICELLMDGVSERKIAEQYHVAHSLIHRIRTKETWVHITNRYTFPEKYAGNYKITPDIVHKICQFISDGKTCNCIAKELHISINIVKDIRRKKTHKNISQYYNF